MYVLPKRKKLFMAARSIICYAGFWLAKAQKGTGKVIADLMLLIVGEQSFNSSSLDYLISSLDKFNQTLEQYWEENRELDLYVAISTIADDLEGFFTSPPQSLMIETANWIVEKTISIKGLPINDISLSVCNRQRKQSFFGKITTQEGHQNYPLQALLPLLNFTLTAAVAQVGDGVKRQIRGGPIGCPLSPAWCVAVATKCELDFLSSHVSYKHTRCKLWQVVRYVDNRYVLSLRVNGQVQLPIELFDPKFYGETIVLKPESKEVLLGTQLLISQEDHSVTIQDPPRIECRYVVIGFPAQYHTGIELEQGHWWRYRTAETASSEKSIMSAFVGRLHLARRSSFPKVRVEQAISRLVFVYKLLGFSSNVLCKYLKRFFKKQPTCVGDHWTRTVIELLRTNNLQSIHSLGGPEHK